MIFVFLLDSSIGMNQFFSNGITVLEAGKSAIDKFLQYEIEFPDGAHSYVLATYAAPIIMIKTSDPKAIRRIVKTVKAKDTSNPGFALSGIFDYLNAISFSSGDHRPGEGVLPSTTSTIILWFTCCGKFILPSAAVSDRLNIAGLKSPGSELYRQPFRSDQVMYTIALVAEQAILNAEYSVMTRVMNGQLWRMSNWIFTKQCIDNFSGFPGRKPVPGVPPFHKLKRLALMSISFEACPGAW